MIHLETKKVNTLVKAIYGNEIFKTSFTDIDPELFDRTAEEKVFLLNQRYSEFETDYLIKKFEWFKTLKKFTYKAGEKAKGLDRVTAKENIDILLSGNVVGLIAEVGDWTNVPADERFVVRFKVPKTEKDLADPKNNKKVSWKWISLNKKFGSSKEAKLWLSNWYAKLQERYTLIF